MIKPAGGRRIIPPLYSRGPSSNRPSICRRPDSHTYVFLSFSFFLFLYVEMSLFSSVFFCTISAFSLYGL